MNEPQLADYDFVMVNSSGGKDSQTTLRQVALKAQAENYPKDRIHVVHADLGHIEWPDAKDLAKRQADHYGFLFRPIARPQGDILQHWEERGKAPSPDNRWCTSDHKRDQIAKLFTQSVATLPVKPSRPVRILNVMGMRAEESRARAKLAVFGKNIRHSNGLRHIDNWLAIHSWSLADVWRDIKESGIEHHYAYDLGMPRLSCMFCIFSPPAALMIAGRQNPALLAEYVRVERKTGHTFKNNFPIENVQKAIASGEDWGRPGDWVM